MKFVLFLTFIATCFTLIKKNFIFLSREERIQRVAFLLFVGFLLAIFYHVGQSVLGYSDPKNTFLFTPGNMFTDFIGPVNNPDIITYSFFTTIVKRLFYSIGLEMSLILFITGSIMFLTLIHIHEITIKTSNIFSTATIVIFSLLNYPALYVINRGNLEMLIFLLLYAFSYFLAKKNFMVSALFLAIAISMKLFPAVFLIVFLSYKEYKAFIYACFLTVFLNIASLAIIVGGKTKNLSMVLSEGIGQYTGGYVKEYVIDNRGLDFGHSLYGLLKLRIFSFHKSASITDVTLPEVTRLFKMYSSIELSIFAILSTYIIFIEKELWKKITLLTISMNLLPYVSADYKLIQFFIPLYLFINKKEKSRTDILYVILFSLLLVPKNYFNIIWNLPDVSFGIFLNPVVMIVLAVLIIGEGLRSTYLENSAKVFAKADLKLR